jgi:hypothetical protein
VPFVVIQVIMVGIVIGFPGLVTGSLHKNVVDPSRIEMQVPTPDYERERLDGGDTAPDISAPKEDKERSGADQGGDLEKLFKQSK